MKEAPLVVYPVGKTRWLAWVLAVGWSLGALMLSLIHFLYFPVDGSRLSTIFMVATALLSGAALMAWWRRQATCTIRWDGERWHLLGAEQPDAMADGGRIEVALDAQRALLLRYRTDVSSRWLWAQASSAPERWHLLRCAIYSRADRSMTEPAPDAPA